jgi:hypothetical protein
LPELNNRTETQILFNLQAIIIFSSIPRNFFGGGGGYGPSIPNFCPYINALKLYLGFLNQFLISSIIERKDDSYHKTHDKNDLEHS